MKITSIHAQLLPDVNLNGIEMAGLGDLVVIAGPNGSGKTRLLKQIEEVTADMQTITKIRSEISTYRRRMGQTSGTPLDVLIKKTDTLQKKLDRINSFAFEGEGRPSVLSFVPKQLHISDPSQMSKYAQIHASNSVEDPGIASLPNGTFARIQTFQDQMWEASHPDSITPDDIKSKATNNYIEYKNLIERFLSTKLTRNIDGEACLFDLPLGKCSLSEGQKIILQLCTAIHAQNIKLNNLIILMDEPENHLHPAALLDLKDAILKEIPDGQLWIATHSIPLLSEVDPSSIWWMENNSLSKGGNAPERVLVGLLGDEQRRDRLATFLDLPASLASNRFTAECLLEPKVASHKANDPQSKQISELLTSLKKKLGKLKILDYGTGKGRLASELAEAWTAEDLKSLNYIAYDSDTKDAISCNAAISLITNNTEGRLFHTYNDLLTYHDKGSFDVVVMCNVFHEIKPSSWSDLFGETGHITELLSDDGYLLLVEVQSLPYGEKAHQDGFLVLDTPQLKELFKIEARHSNIFLHDSKRQGWLKAHLIGKSLLKNYSQHTKLKALIDLSTTARREIRRLRDDASNYRNGRLHGFWLHQFANAELVIHSS